MAIAAFLFRSPGLLNRGPGGPAPAGSGFHSSNWNTDFKLWSPSNWLPVAPGLYIYLPPTYFLWRHNSHSIQPVDSQGYPPISSTGCTCYLHRCISLTARSGRWSIFYSNAYLPAKVIGEIWNSRNFWDNPTHTTLLKLDKIQKSVLFCILILCKNITHTLFLKSG